MAPGPARINPAARRGEIEDGGRADDAAYFRQLSHAFGSAWTRFWFTPRDPLVLCLMRVLTGIVALYYVVSHSADLVRWFGPDGILNASTTQ